ncbi:MAG: hypothetical protein Udaeo2_28560 [Candidatus Udaeobacter sp.]|nr:MAG: hypothetical protein Udaeo2_28560 [Candidatus Udaeobacter sp.]
MRHDVVDHTHEGGGMLLQQLFQIRNHPGCRFRAERHRLAVQAAEGAVVLLAPPAAATALVRKRDMVQKGAVRRVVIELFVVRRELWRWQ